MPSDGFAICSGCSVCGGNLFRREIVIYTHTQTPQSNDGWRFFGEGGKGALGGDGCLLIKFDGSGGIERPQKMGASTIPAPATPKMAPTVGRLGVKERWARASLIFLFKLMCMPVCRTMGHWPSTASRSSRLVKIADENRRPSLSTGHLFAVTMVVYSLPP